MPAAAEGGDIRLPASTATCESRTATPLPGWRKTDASRLWTDRSCSSIESRSGVCRPAHLLQREIDQQSISAASGRHRACRSSPPTRRAERQLARHLRRRVSSTRHGRAVLKSHLSSFDEGRRPRHEGARRSPQRMTGLPAAIICTSPLLAAGIRSIGRMVGCPLIRDRVEGKLSDASVR